MPDVTPPGSLPHPLGLGQQIELPGGPHQGVALPFQVWFGLDEGVAKLLFAEEVLQHDLADSSSVQGRDVIGQDVPITRPHRVLQARAHLRLFEVVVEVPWGPQDARGSSLERAIGPLVWVTTVTAAGYLGPFDRTRT